jgi:hypothetical protein
LRDRKQQQQRREQHIDGDGEPHRQALLLFHRLARGSAARHWVRPYVRVFVQKRILPVAVSSHIVILLPFAYLCAMIELYLFAGYL